MKKKVRIRRGITSTTTTAFTYTKIMDPTQNGEVGEASVSANVSIPPTAWDNFAKRYIFNEDQNISTPSSPERVMFIAVFLQSLLDATKPAYDGEPRSSIANRDCAIKWFTLPECVTASTFEPICELAGIDPDYARKYFNLIMEGEREFTYRRINILLNSTKT